MAWLTIDLTLFAALFAHMAGRVKYRLGAKAPNLNCDSSQITRLDCSGVVRYVLHRAGIHDVPDGSQAQLAWCRQKGFKTSSYDANGAGRCDGALRIAFASPKGGKAWPRHVWFIHNGRTYESYAGHGVGSRQWNNPKLTSIVSACYVLTRPTKST